MLISVILVEIFPGRYQNNKDNGTCMMQKVIALNQALSSSRFFKTKIVLTHSFVHVTVHIYFSYYYPVVLFTEKPFSGVFLRVDLI